ncbi:MAG: hypothetical protein AB7Q42_11420 [Acidimicrobiia bacterium]
MLLVHAGNRVDLPGRGTPRFPPALVPLVRRRVAQVLTDLRPRGVVSAAAAGADLIVLEEAIEAGITIHLALPLGVEQFRARAVEDLGGDWAERYDRVLAEATEHGTVHIENRGNDEDWFTEGNETILDRAEMLSDGDSIYALVVRPHSGESLPSATDRFAASAAKRGWPVIELGITP